MDSLIILLAILFVLDVALNPRRRRARKRVVGALRSVGRFFRRIGHRFPSVRRRAVRNLVIGKVAANIERAWENKEKKDYVYVVRNSFGDYKVGTTGSGLQRRMASFKTANSRQMWLVGLALGTDELEKRLHEQLDHVRTETDNEWFHSGYEIDELLRHVGIDPVPLFK